MNPPVLIKRLYRKFIQERAGFGRPIPKAVLDNEYTSGSWEHFHELSESARQILMAGMVAQLHREPAVLDVGCGSGRLAQLFQPFPFSRYLGVDLSSEGVARARSLNLKGCDFLEGDFETWRPHEIFDVIMFSECIGYARDPGALVASFVPFLRPGGHILISYFRCGHWAAHWRRVQQHLGVIEATTITNGRGQTWDLKVLQPSAFR